MIHDLKILPEYFEAVKDMRKPFEVRRETDRYFSVGDELLLREYSLNIVPEKHDDERYTGNVIRRIITYKLNLADNLVVLGLSII